MKISRGGRVVTLGRRDTKKWQDSGPEGNDFRKKAREICKGLIAKNKASVEIYASASAGGWTADVLPYHRDEHEVDG